MIENDKEFEVTLELIARFQAQLASLRMAESNPANYHAAASGFIRSVSSTLRHLLV